MRIRHFNTDERVLVVAEVGNNHEGNFEVAKELVRQARVSGADAVKFQTFQTEYFVGTADPARFKRLKSFELAYDQFAELARLAKSLGLIFFASPFDLESARFLNGIVDCFKIASGDNTFWPLIEYVCTTEKPLIISSGLTDLEQVKRIQEFVGRQWPARSVGRDLAILHCVSSYPAPDEQVNLAVLPVLARELGCTIGYSDHTIGIEACLAAVAAGARIIEKHFTLHKDYSSFRDHQLSADPNDMRALVHGIRRIETFLRKPEKKLQPSEEKGVELIRRSIAARADLPRGHHLALGDLMWIRPATGLPPGAEDHVIGKALARDVSFGEQIRPEDVIEDKNQLLL